MSSQRVEFRLTWRRAYWRRTTVSQSRRFSRRPDLDRFLEKLEDFDAVDHWVHVREVGPWQPVDCPACRGAALRSKCRRCGA